MITAGVFNPNLSLHKYVNINFMFNFMASVGIA